MWRGFKEIWTYNRRQRNGLLILVLIAIVLQVIIYFNIGYGDLSKEDFRSFEKAAAKYNHCSDSVESLSAGDQSIPFHDFDPNKISKEGFIKMGLGENIAQTILNYRKAGGRFQSSEDLLHIYGMDSSWLQKAIPYIHIAHPTPTKNKEIVKPDFSFHDFDPNVASIAEFKNMGLQSWQAKHIITYRKKVKPFGNSKELFKVYGLDSALVQKMLPYVEIDSTLTKQEKAPGKKIVVAINRADSLQLLKLPGIGPVYAGRIIKYRDELGGFIKLDQLLEVYGMDQQRIDQFKGQIKIDANHIHKLNVNKAGFKDLLKHPYLNYNVVRNIIYFREHVRPFKKVSELRNIELIDDKLFSKIANYLTTSEDPSN